MCVHIYIIDSNRWQTHTYVGKVKFVDGADIFMCMCICIYVCMYVYIYLCMYVCICIYIIGGKERKDNGRAHRRQDIQGNCSLYWHSWYKTFTCIHVYVYIYIYIHVYIYTSKKLLSLLALLVQESYIYIRIYVYMKMCM